MKRYLRPLGLLSGTAARDAIAAGLALPLAGGPLAFSLVEVIERFGPGDILRKVVPASAYDLKPLARETGEGGTHRLRWEGEGAGGLQHINPPHLPTADAAGPFLSRVAGEELSGMRATIVMGIVNATPDSFSDGGAYFAAASAIDHATAMNRPGLARPWSQSMKKSAAPCRSSPRSGQSPRRPA
jgi:dihydropteroate synthase